MTADTGTRDDGVAAASSATATSSVSSTSIRRPAALAVGLAVAWTAVEFAVRRGATPPLADATGSGLGAAGVVFVVGFPVVAALVAWVGLRAGVAPADWAYDRSLRGVAAAVAGLVAYFVVVIGAAAVLSTAGADGGTAAAAGALDAAAGAAPTWALVAFFLGNGVVVPLTEELAWRGVIQTSLTEAYGPAVAVVATGALFVGKHLVVDLSAAPLRVASLVALALVFGVLRARYGTTSSTVAHLLANGLATGGIVVAAL